MMFWFFSFLFFSFFVLFLIYRVNKLSSLYQNTIVKSEPGEDHSVMLKQEPNCDSLPNTNCPPGSHSYAEVESYEDELPTDNEDNSVSLQFI